MKTVEEILEAVEKLDAAGFMRLRKKLDRLEQKLWDQELKRTTAAMKKAKITDEDIDRTVLRRRRESRR
jgi:hypothetical protein